MKDRSRQLRKIKKNPEDGPKITVIGGGTGLSTMLRGLKLYSTNISAIVTVADDGGSSGLLRKDYGIIPPGDIRNCLMALADTETVMEELMNYRFTDGSLKGQNFGNLFITALTGVSGNFYDAIRNFSNVLAVTGRVIPVSLTDIHISAKLKDGTYIHGESAIGDRKADINNPISRISMNPSDAKAFSEAVDAVSEADLLVLGPGSLYTSIIPNLLFPEIRKAILDGGALCVYVCNIMTQPAETMGMDLETHLSAVLNYFPESRKNWLDFAVVNSEEIPEDLIAEYAKTGSEPVKFESDRDTVLGVQIIKTPLAGVKNGKIRHDYIRLAKVIASLALEGREIKELNAKTKVYVREDED